MGSDRGQLSSQAFLSLTGPEEEVVLKRSGSTKGGKSSAKETHIEKRIQFKGHERSHGENDLFAYMRSSI